MSSKDIIETARIALESELSISISTQHAFTNLIDLSPTSSGQPFTKTGPKWRGLVL